MSLDISQFLDELDRARAEATPGPWAQHPDDGAYIIGEVGEGPDGPEWLDVGDTGGRPPGYPGSAHADAALIVAAVNAVPRLTAALRAVLTVAVDLDRDADYHSLAAVGSHDHGVHEAQGDAADRIRDAITAALSPEATS
jgi:hypothetical protein